MTQFMTVTPGGKLFGQIVVYIVAIEKKIIIFAFVN